MDIFTEHLFERIGPMAEPTTTIDTDWERQPERTITASVQLPPGGGRAGYAYNMGLLAQGIAEMAAADNRVVASMHFEVRGLPDVPAADKRLAVYCRAVCATSLPRAIREA